MDTPQLLLDNQLCFRLYTASRLITQAYEPLFRPMGITYTQYLVLLVLWEEDHQPVNTIGRRLQLGINTTSPLIKRMEAQDLVYRTASDTDKRQQIIHLTERGRAMQAEAASIPTCLVDKMQHSGIDLQACRDIMPTLDSIISAFGDMHDTADKKR